MEFVDGQKVMLNNLKNTGEDDWERGDGINPNKTYKVVKAGTSPFRYVMKDMFVIKVKFKPSYYLASKWATVIEE